MINHKIETKGSYIFGFSFAWPPWRGDGSLAKLSSISILNVFLSNWIWFLECNISSNFFIWHSSVSTRGASEKMADHSTIILFPTLIVLLMSGYKVQGSVQDISFFKNTVGIVNRMAREGNITTHQKSAINNVVRILSEKTSQIVGGQTLEQIQRNFTAVERVSIKFCILLFLLC